MTPYISLPSGHNRLHNMLEHCKKEEAASSHCVCIVWRVAFHSLKLFGIDYRIHTSVSHSHKKYIQESPIYHFEIGVFSKYCV